MELEFIFSEVYHNNLNRFAAEKHNWKIVKSHCQSFIERYNSVFPNIIKAIQSVTKRDFSQDKVKVYLVGWEGASFSNPLTLNAGKDMLLMLTTLVHELLHITFKEEKSSLELEEKINDYVELVFDIIKISAKEQIEIMRKYSREKYNEK